MDVLSSLFTNDEFIHAEIFSSVNIFSPLSSPLSRLRASISSLVHSHPSSARRQLNIFSSRLSSLVQSNSIQSSWVSSATNAKKPRKWTNTNIIRQAKVVDRRPMVPLRCQAPHHRPSCRVQVNPSTMASLKSTLKPLRWPNTANSAIRTRVSTAWRPIR